MLAGRHLLRGLAVGLLGLVVGCGDERGGSPRTQEPPAKPATPQAVTTTSGIRMVLLPAGQFVMGDDGGEDDEKPAHTVSVSAFYMDVHEVTQKDYVALLGKNPSLTKGDDLPAEQMSWTFAARYCNLRSLKEGLQPCYDLGKHPPACNFQASGYRLPTEAEWEYACRAGGRGRYAFGDDPRRLAEHAWFEGNARKKTHPVATTRPNAWGLYDLHGNVWEWCHDRYGERYYAESPGKDPRGPATGDERVLRGGGWRSGAEACRCAARFYESPGLADVCFGYEEYGFRCVRRAP